MSRLNQITADSASFSHSHADERRAYADFASRYGEAPYRGPVFELYAARDGFNTDPERRQVG